ncbi:MAG: GTP-binding protein [Ruminococcaceae bacterium]|nr:GTP-binding protein [Oscillospiraceae bacterium]
MKRLAVGILAHVDAGKTTLSEGLLFSSGATSRLGRVDRRDAFLDNYSLERERGITIFSKLALLHLENTEITLVDTPGHIDFSCEAERSLSVQDYAILVISAPDGVESHTKTLWNLLSARNIPTFVFINKTDISERTRYEIMSEIKEKLSPACVDFSSSHVKEEDAAGADEALMKEYFDTGSLTDTSIAEAISERRIFPCYFGSALKMNGIREFLFELDRYTLEPGHSERIFGARVYKISRDPSGKRLTYMKITGGKLSAKDALTVKDKNGDVHFEKVEEIRLYSGEKYKAIKDAAPGMLCAVTGIAHTEAGMGLGFEKNDETSLSPVLDYKMILPRGVSIYEAYLKISALTEEDPALSISYNERAKEIRVRLMGEIQTEVLRRLIEERFGIAVGFSEGSILYKETVAEAVQGAGHFEPLRHYAEVHLRIEPLPEGSGVICTSECSTDLLLLNWQRLVMTHLEERTHKGVLTGSPLTDVKIILTAGKAHQKHTEGGDFRQATYRAVRQGLMKSKSVLLEPTFDFRIELPTENLGRAMTDISSMYGKTEPPEISGNTAILVGSCPVSTMRSYATELRAYTRGEGKITMTVGAYMPCHNAEEVIKKIGYNAELDERNTPNSVFCKAGSGYIVPWYEADEAMHLACDEGSEDAIFVERAVRSQKTEYKGTAAEDKELMRIFESTYGKIKPRTVSEKTENAAATEKKPEKPKKQKPIGDDYLIIDGYNYIFAIERFRRLAEMDISLARDTLTRIMCDYSAFRKCKVVIVFDAYKRPGSEERVEHYADVSVVYTREAETADRYIEKTTHDIADKHKVRVVTSDYQEQLVVLGSGGLRVSAAEFSRELDINDKEIKEAIDSLK